MLDDLGFLAHRLGRPTEAESLYARALQTMERVVDLDKRDLESAYEKRDYATLLDHFAALLRDLDRDVEAKSLDVRAKAIQALLEEKSSPK